MQERTAPTFHVGVIMDGNGRWAEARGLGRVAGHARGARRVTEIVKACPDLGVTHLTLYAFSTENWQRPLAEVEGLMRIFGQYILGKMDGLRRNDVRVRFIGMRHRVPPRLRGLMEMLEARTRDCRGLTLSIAIDYGGRDELTRAVRALSREVEAGRLRAGGDLARRRSPRRSTPAGCPIRTSSSAPRASSGSRTSCSGRASTPSTTFPGSPGRTSPSGISPRRSRASGCGSAASAAPTWRSPGLAPGSRLA